MKKLHLSSSLSIPLEAVTQTFAILAVKGSGKSYTGSVMAEEMLEARQQIVVLDPTGAWWGLQSTADGKREGFPIVVFGGDHGNVPLEETAGEIIARAIVEQNFSAIIDLSLLRKGESNRFVGLFLETLYRINRQPLHLFVDEADAFAPQKPFDGQARTLGAMEDIVRRGRKRGIGCTMITQRPAVINKDVLTQCEILIALRMSHPKDINAIMEWVQVHATKEDARVMIDSLPSMKTGTAWVWSPSWLHIFKQVNIRLRGTFDSGATPKPGERIVAPKKLAQIDIKALGEKINETVERKKADDPKELKNQLLKQKLEIDSLKKMLEKGNNPETKKQLEDVRREIAGKDRIIAGLQDKIKRMLLYYATMIKDFSVFMKTFNVGGSAIDKSFDVVDEPKLHISFPLVGHPATGVPKKVALLIDENSPVAKQKSKELHNRIFSTKDNSEDVKIGKCENSILTALAMHGKSSKSRLGILSRYSSTSGSFGNSLGKLKKLGYIEGRGDDLEITALGRDNAKYEPLPAPGEELQRWWLNTLPKCERTILDYLIQRHPFYCSKEEIGTATKYSADSGSFGNSIGKLRTLQLIEGRGEVKAVDDLFR